MHWMKGKETLNAFASLSQASDQLICINHLVYILLNQRGDIIYRLVSCYPYHLALVPEFFALLWSHLRVFVWCELLWSRHCGGWALLFGTRHYWSGGREYVQDYLWIDGTTLTFKADGNSRLKAVQRKQAFHFLTDCVYWLINHLPPCNRSSSWGFHLALKKHFFFYRASLESYCHQYCRSTISLVLVLCIFVASTVLKLQIKPASVGIPINKLFIYLHLHHNAHMGVFCVFLHYCSSSIGNYSAISHSAREYLMFMAALSLPRVSNKKEY